MFDFMNFGTRLKHYRSQRGLSLQDLEKKTGISHASLSYYENSKRTPGMDKIRLLADALEVPVSALYGEKEKEPTPNSLSAQEKELLGTILGDIQLSRTILALYELKKELPDEVLDRLAVGLYEMFSKQPFPVQSDAQDGMGPDSPSTGTHE